MTRWMIGPAMVAILACGTDEAGVQADASSVSLPEVDEPADVADVSEPRQSEDVEFPWDLPETDLVEADPDVGAITPEQGFTGCPTLGVSPKWAGTFEGVVTYDLEGGPDSEPTQGLFLVKGDIEFEIQCLDQKLLISGQLAGDAEAAGRIGVHPFAANLFGDFNYLTRTIDAQLLDGEVRIYKVVSVYYAGNFDGAVTPQNTFEGTWDAVHTGNDLDYEGVASGQGKWTAFPVAER